MKSIVVALALLFTNVSFAKDLKVGVSEATFQIVKISATQVKGVNISLATEIERDDCNQRSIQFDLSYLSGNKDFGWHQTLFANAGVSMTEMYCPLDTPVTETITSEAVFVNSLINRNADGEVELTLVVPTGFDVVVKEVKK
jgi:hypothetical protein